MTSSTHHHPNHVSGCYRPAPIQADFVPSPRNVHFRLQCGREIASAQPATDHLGDAIARMKGLTAASLQHTTIQIPIATIPPLAACQTARGFLLQGLSEACPLNSRVNWRTARKKTLHPPNCTWSRVIRPVAPPSRAGTAGSRRSFRSRVRYSMSRRRVSTRCCPRPRSAR